MISCRLMGRMGNQMFIIATTIAYALRERITYHIPWKSGKRDQFDCYFPHLCSHRDTSSYQVIREQQFGIYHTLPVIDPDQNYKLQGYFQSEKYFRNYRREIIEAFGILRYPTELGLVSIHVRRGDYLRLNKKHPPIDLAYIRDAMSYFDNNHRFLVFSDDIEWCKNNIKGRAIDYWVDDDPIESMAMMASCHHNIISNSTFSWWGAWLNGNDNKVIIAPKRWFGERVQDRVLHTQDIIPQTWIKL